MRSTSRVRRLGSLATIVVSLGLVLTSVGSAAATATDTGKLAFVRGNQVFTSTTTGASVKQLTTSGKNYLPHWSPDGKRIAFVHEAPAGHRDLWVMKGDGTAKSRVTHLGDTTEPAWSPDGKWLAFGAEGSPPYDGAFDYTLRKIRSTAPYGSPVVLPTGDNDARVAGSLDWSPDGKQIAFVSHTFPASPDSFLLTYTLATKEVELVDEVGGSCCGEGRFANPAWTPNSRTIAYSVVRYPIDQPAPAGAHLEFASMTGTALPTFPAVVGDSDPDWSPTGKKLVFSHWSRIYTANADGTKRTNVLAGYSPDWQPVG
jgi:Tol biopolymer transport system component